MARALLLGGSFSAIPIYKALCGFDVEVQLCSANPEEPLHGYQLETHLYNYSDSNSVSKIISKNRIDFIIPSCNDVAYNTAVEVAKIYSLPGFDSPVTAKVISDKQAFRSRFADKISMPKHINFLQDTKEILEQVKFPLLAKPKNGFSGLGITQIESIYDLETFLSSVKVDEFSIEEKQVGSLHSHSAFIKDGQIYNDFFVDEFCVRNPFQVDCSNHPSLLSNTVKDKMRIETAIIVKELELVDGLLHTQFLSNKEEVYVIETMRRCPGDLFGDLIEKSTNFNYYESYVKTFLNRERVSEQSRQNPTPVIRHTVAKSKAGIFEGLSIYPTDFEIELVPIIRCGELISNFYLEKIGISFLYPNGLEKMKTIVMKAASYFKINLERGF